MNLFHGILSIFWKSGSYGILMLMRDSSSQSIEWKVLVVESNFQFGLVLLDWSERRTLRFRTEERTLVGSWS